MDDASEASWLSDLMLKETEDCNLFRHSHLETLLDDDDELLSHEIASAFENLHQPLYSETFERSTKQPKTNASSSPSSPTSKILLSFDNSSDSAALSPNQIKNKGVSVSVSLPQTRKRSSENHNFQTESPKGPRSYKSPSYARDHIIAERKRREKLSQSLIALAALIPGLKKMDRASVLGNAIKYVKELQERLRMLEEENKVMVNKAKLSCEDDIDGSASREDEEGSERLPRVEARVSEKDVLLRIHCQKQKGLLLKILVEIQKFHLFVVSSSVLPFGDSILDITIVAQMEKGYNLTINDIVKNLRVATLKSMS
ncbi:hypothetical protein AAZX31_11G042700 [Glycine max]|uniref:BHLH domain-containing protein n=3 Tax=Glycine subgen. Soja TaxID=1462606 RepID=K7LN10_SOYBN|nr:transcription factor bHLH25 [Glycine max]XP_028189061.1 transcription factor bHLH25-like [Glycine soja]KAG4993311.1 hypothetical protein JHK86_030138 [Glycine max]KAG5123314.1 hypothetical protein JHK82_030051 [Glycine max]KAH1157562.1 hypothetical protein GYH30_030004 [Glycine max]KAH1223617.1 Transcription factor bHLH25 [Glycine max]KHN13037.1 Transcription factor bHLH25 [Glycine soja]|eukprot:XP_003539216.1 transcription factor bHLH25 isoform X1 [Glycine max]